MTSTMHDTAAEESLVALHEIARLLGSAKDSEARVVRVLEHLRSLVPYERCAVLEARPGSEPRLITPDGATEAERLELTLETSGLLALLREDGRVSEPLASGNAQLAVPLIGLEEVVGVLFVRGTAGGYGELQVRRLSVVAAQLGAYFSMLHAAALEAQRTEELEEARLAAQAANRARDEFLALVSHELRTPLNTILVWADALRSKQTPDADRTRAFDGIARSVRAETQLIEDLLDLSGMAKATLRLDRRTVEPVQLIQAVIVALLPGAEQKSIRVEAVFDESVTPLIADARRLTQIVTHLVANAIKFTPHGGQVEVHLERAGKFARLRVSDTGAGISTELLPRLFQRFGQGDSSSTRAHGGLGVGLALVKNLVELHGGQVHAQSAGAQQGATFTVELPLAEAALAVPERPEAPGRAAQAAGLLKGITVLLVDDDRDLCEVLQFVLEGQGAVVTVASSAAEALASLEGSMPNVLLSDIAMPGQTGYDLMRRIVAREGVGAPPAAALSGYAKPGQDLPKVLASGFRMLLAKPIDSRTLIAAVMTLAKDTSGPAAPRRDEASA
jgi:signal transduction histidine kinase/ActR/RegA family two-component response regulator